MNNENIIIQLNTVFRDVFNDNKIMVEARTVSSDIDGWDSLMHISLISAIENEFDIKFSMKDIVGMKNVGEMIEIIERECRENM
ncbi:MAG: acyl carrier protein [Clostridiales bacterium]|jgi:acyl carrier protein|nr:acyl carrier protein [Clostridiales bacterium]